MGCVLTFEAEEALAGAAVRLGAAQVAGWSEAEQRLADAAAYPGESEISQLRSQVLAGATVPAATTVSAGTAPAVATVPSGSAVRKVPEAPAVPAVPAGSAFRLRRRSGGRKFLLRARPAGHLGRAKPDGQVSQGVLIGGGGHVPHCAGAGATPTPTRREPAGRPAERAGLASWRVAIYLQQTFRIEAYNRIIRLGQRKVAGNPSQIGGHRRLYG